MSWLLVLVWMAVIFSASSDSMSFSHSSRIIGPIVHWLFPQASDATIHTVVVFIRKCAHLTEYAILALLVWHALRQMHKTDSRSWRWVQASQVALLVLLYAATDEFHQLFVPSRQASVMDVLLDTAGGVFALLFLWAIGRWRRRW
ncbi:MAG TPA: VanZ family protein [Candidatus Binatia bacterium]|jgi:VanZ family protein|nr:VanZ family protein [Candidatus Binatia bacterium]